MRLVRPEIIRFFYGAGALALSLFYFEQYPVPGLLSRLGELGLAAAMIFLSAGAGGRLLGLLGVSHGETPMDRFLFRVGAGLPVFSLGFLALGLAGAYRPGWMFLVLAASAVICRREISGAFLELRDAVRGVRVRGLWAASFSLALLCAFAPPTFYDSLVYHLALPAKYLQEGRISFVPYSQYAHFPQNMEVLYGVFMALGNDVSAQVFTVFLGLLTGFVLDAMVRAWDGTERARNVALFLFATAPCALLLSCETYVEVPMAFITGLAVLSAGRALSGGDRGGWVLAGILGGWGAGVKYTGVMTPVLLTLLALFWPRIRPWRERGKDAAAVAGISFLLFLPWMIKNAVMTGGNPVFPFLPSFFLAENVYLPVEASRAYFQVLDEYKGSSALLSDLFSLPLRILFKAQSFGGGYDVTGDYGWALPILLFPLAAGLWRRNVALRPFLAYAAAHALLWGMMRPVLRFLFPVFPLACALAGTGLARVMEHWGAGWRRAAGVWLLFFVFSNGIIFYQVQRVRDPFAPVLGWETDGDYLLRKLDHARAYAWSAQNLPADAQVLLIGDQRGYRFPRAYVAPMALLPTPLRAWADGRRDGEALREELVKSGFTHLLFHRKEAERLKGYRVLDLTPSGAAAWADFTGRAPALYSDEAVTIYDLRD